MAVASLVDVLELPSDARDPVQRGELDPLEDVYRTRVAQHGGESRHEDLQPGPSPALGRVLAHVIPSSAANFWT